MGKKYIIELEDNQMAYATTVIDGMAFIKLLQTLPYTEPDLEQVRKEAYDEGYDDAKGGYENGFENGMIVAWDAAKKIALMDTETSENVTGYFGLFRIMENLTPMQAIEKLKAYEQERFHLGDEFENESGKRFVILKMNGTEIDRYIDEEGKTYHMNVKYKVMRKTGRHFPEITTFFKKMRGE